MKFRDIATVYCKELRDALRDRRTIISMFVVPTLVIPLIILGFLSMSTRAMSRARAEVPVVMILGGEDSPAIRSALQSHRRLKIVPADPEFRQRISEKHVRAAIELPRDFDAAVSRGEPAAVRIYTYEKEMKSEFAANELDRFFRGYSEQTIRSRLASRGLPAELTRPFSIARQNVAPPEKVGGAMIGGFVPYLIILLCFTGAMYPAMDLTAGEKERGTMETLLCSPVGRTEIVLGKFLVVLTAALATVILAGVAALVTFPLGGMMIARPVMAAATQGALPVIDRVGFALALGLVAPVAVLFSAGLFTISLFAKTYKEAQSYVSPLIIVVILPAGAALLPGFDLNPRLALIPILNVSLACKELVSGVYNWGYLALIFGSTSVYAAAALALAVRMFNRETVIFRS